MGMPVDSSQGTWNAELQTEVGAFTTELSDKGRITAIENMGSLLVIDGSPSQEKIKQVAIALLDNFAAQSEPVQKAIIAILGQFPTSDTLDRLVNEYAASRTPIEICTQIEEILKKPDTWLDVVGRLAGRYSDPRTSADICTTIAELLGGTALSDTIRDLKKTVRSGDAVVADRSVRVLASLALTKLPGVEPAIYALREAVAEDAPGKGYAQPDASVRAHIHEVLVREKHLDLVLKALLDDQPKVQEFLEAYIMEGKSTHHITWQEITNALFKLLAENNRYQSADIRSDIVSSKIVRVMQPAVEEAVPDAEALPKFLMEKAVLAQRDRNERMVNILAVLLEASMGYDQDRAVGLIGRYQKEHGTPDGDVAPLRSQIGGRKALEPLMDKLAEDLKKYFQEPVNELNGVTQASWETTIKYARWGFIVRTVMSVIVFTFGVALVSISAYQILSGARAPDQVWGPGITFLSGLGTMLLVTYSGPLKDIRESISDLGVASAVFIGYVHRVLQISHTFSYYYLEKKITYDDMKNSGAQISDAMHDVIVMLPRESPKGRKQTGKGVTDGTPDGTVC